MEERSQEGPTQSLGKGRREKLQVSCNRHLSSEMTENIYYHYQLYMCDRHFQPWLHVPQVRLPFPKAGKTRGEMTRHISLSSVCICNID